MAYKYTLNYEEKSILNSIENSKIRNSLMSIYTYLNLKSEDNILAISFSKLLSNYKKYKRNVDTNISRSTLENRIKKLVEIKLVKITKIKNINQYVLYNSKFFNQELDDFLDDSKQVQSTENTSLESNSILHKYINNINKDYKDSYSNSDNNNLDNLKKCSSLVDVRNRVRELLNKLRVKSTWIKDRVLNKLTKYYRKITIKFLDNYINKAIEDSRKQYYANYKKFSNKNLTVNNFTEREDRALTYMQLEE